MVRKIVWIVAVGLLVCVTGYFGFTYLMTFVTELNTTTSIGELCDIVLNFTAIFVTVLLGIVVYFQSERINKLEAAQYDVFIGIEKIDFSAAMGNEWRLISDSKDGKEKNIKLFRDVADEGLSLLAHAHMGERQEKLFIPFAFVTRNTPLITGIQVKRIDIAYNKIVNGRKRHSNVHFAIDAYPICCVLPDNSHFMLHLGIHGVRKEDVEGMEVKFYFNVTDQLKRSHAITTEVNLSKIHEELRILSSRTDT